MDAALAERLSAALGPTMGPALLEHRYDHEHEHSIELQVPWIQHVFGTDEAGAYPKVLGLLVHDPSVRNGESYDGKGVAFEPFVRALREAIAALPGRTLIVASADLSHVGPAFGDQTAMAGEDGPGAEARNEVVRGDLELLKHMTDNKPEALVSSMAWRQNPTRWCSIGNLAAAAAVVQPKETRLLHFHAALDEQGLSMVTSAAMVMN
jgi:AmmeMemoRadiSam system protein B